MGDIFHQKAAKSRSGPKKTTFFSTFVLRAQNNVIFCSLMQLNRILMENRNFFGYSQLCRSRFLYVKRHFTYSTICEWYSVIFGLGVITQRSYPHFMILTRIENRTCHIATRLVLNRQIITSEITYTLYVKTKVLYVNDTLRFSNEK